MKKYDGYNSTNVWVRVSQCPSADLFAYTGQNTLSVNKISALVNLRAIINEIFNK